MTDPIFRLLYPSKCILCEKLLTKGETDLCHSCRQNVPVFTKGKFKISFVARWTALWYYKENVRSSMLRYKFANRRHYGYVYGRLLAMKLLQEGWDDFDVLTWVPISFRRFWKRGFDQTALIAKVVGKELGRPARSVLRKHRHTPPQSGIRDDAARRANVLGAYRVKRPAKIAGKRILLLDDIITTGSTLSECAKTLMIAGAEKVICTAVAAAGEHKK